MKKNNMIGVARIIVILSISTFLCSGKLFSEDETTYMKTKLISESPHPIQSILEVYETEFGMSDIKSASLVTGIDSVSVYFGSMIQEGTLSYWISLNVHNSELTFSPITLFKTDSLSFMSNKIDLDFDKGRKRISFRIMHNPDTDEVFYVWMQKGVKRPTAQIVDGGTPNQINNNFPQLEVELLSGEKLNIVDLQGKYVVINWWHSACGPCIASIPGLNQLVDKYRNNTDVEFLAIALDSRERIESLLKHRKFKFTQALGNEESFKILGNTFPRYLILNPQGVIIYSTFNGSDNSYEAIDFALEKQLAE